MEKPNIKRWPSLGVSGAKRANLHFHDPEGTDGWDWWVGSGKDESCHFDGTWWDMICFARNILASENTKLAAPEFHKPEWANDNYCDDRPYEYGK